MYIQINTDMTRKNLSLTTILRAVLVVTTKIRANSEMRLTLKHWCTFRKCNVILSIITSWKFLNYSVKECFPLPSSRWSTLYLHPMIIFTDNSHSLNCHFNRVLYFIIHIWNKWNGKWIAFRVNLLPLFNNRNHSPLKMITKQLNYF